MNTNTYRMAWKNADKADGDWSIDMATKPMPDWAMAAFLDDLRQHCPHLDVKSVPVEHTILDPQGTRYSNQDPTQLDAIDTQSRGERA